MLLVEAAALSLAVTTATLICVPCILCCCIWTWYAGRRVYRTQLECDEWRGVATNMTIRQFAVPVSEAKGDPDVDDDFPAH